MYGVGSKSLAVVAIVGLLSLVGCQEDDDVGPNPGTGGGGTNVGGNTGEGGSGDEDAATSDADDIGYDTNFDRQVCRENFVETAVSNTAWYMLDCEQPREDSEDRCQQGSRATERFLTFDDNGTYWFNTVTYDNFYNKDDWGGWCRSDARRDGELSWEMIACNRVRLTTGCGDTEMAWLTQDGDLLFESRHGTFRMRKKSPQEIRAGRMRNPLDRTGCFDDRKSAEPMCIDQ